MTGAPSFDVLAHPLGGTHLVEASAGTGKTFSITTLVVRTLLETALSIERILVVSFTRASAADLRGRVRERIHATLTAFEEGRCDDPVLRVIVARHDRADGIARLQAALSDFDRAAIYTIHAFCQRALVEFAFQSGEPFAVEFVEGADELCEELCQDHWASVAYTAEAGWLETVADVFAGPSSLRDLAKHAAEWPDLRLLPAESAPDPARTGTLRARFEACAALWRTGEVAIRAQLDYDNGALLADYKADRIAGPLAALGLLLSGPTPSGALLPDGCELFTADRLREKTRARTKAPPPSHPFFAAWQAYVDLAAAVRADELVALQRALHAVARARLDLQKDARNIRAYSDLLVRLADALRGTGGPGLADAIFARYPAALIDEFQDTDAVQFGVFQRVYDGGRGSLFLIGDPKQAIYAFRGGDIYAYLRAIDGAARATLGVNYRSDPPLVQALGTLYRRSHGPFVDARIPFHDVGADKRTRIRGPSASPAPLQLKLLRKDGKGKKNITGEWANKHLARLIAGDVVRFLQSDAKLLRGRDPNGEEIWTPPRASDVAVLVRKNVDAERVQRALLARGVHSVVSVDTSVFESEEAVALSAVLQAVLSPSSDRLLRAAVTTSIVGLDANRLFVESADDAVWARWASRFRGLRELWVTRGFAALFRALLVERLDDVVLPAQERLLAEPGGDRRVTNLLHLGELLQDRAQQRSLTPLGLASWFAQRLAGAGTGADDDQMRLESDADAAKVMTVYKAKGLEFPVVWCPYGHLAFGPDAVRPVFHGDLPDEAATVSLDPGEWGDGATVAGVELAAQERRVLYVTLTRAAHRVTVFWGEWNGSEKSALASLLHPAPALSADATPAAIVAAAKAHAGTLDEDARMAELAALAETSGGLIEASWIDEEDVAAYRPGDATEAALTLGVFGGSIRTSWRRTSYSGLTSNRQHVATAELADHDEGAEDSEVPVVPTVPAAHPGDTEPCGFRDFPRGKRPGVVLHALFEHADFLDAGPALDEVVAATLGQARLDIAALAGPTAASVRAVLATPLGGTLGDFTLGQLPRSHRLDELAFTFPVSGRGSDAEALRQRDLAALLRRHGLGDLAARVERFAFGRLRGHLTGLMDLVFAHDGRFYVVDYKSNFLGDALGDYHPGALAAEMAHHDYDLQYLVYGVALHRYLALRQPGYRFADHFGGVRYLFIRGMTPATGAARGVFEVSPSEALMDGLSALFRDPRRGAA